MTAHQCIYVAEKNAAKMLDMPLADFRRLVAGGSLPPPFRIGGEMERWRVADLDALISGEVLEGEFEV